LNFELGHASKEPSEQVGAFRVTQSIRPRSAYVAYALGVTLYAQKQHAAAEAAYRRAIELDANFAGAHGNLGLVLDEHKGAGAGEAAYRRAIELDPKNYYVLVNFGAMLQSLNRLDEAVGSFQRAVELNPRSSRAHNNLGSALRDQKQLDQAIVHFRTAIEIDANPVAWCNLGHAFMDQSKFSEALAAFKKGHDLGSALADWNFPSAQWIDDAQRMIMLDLRLEEVLKGEVVPSGAGEYLALARLCVRQRRKYAAGVRFFAQAVAADPGMAAAPSDDRYDAACAAALAAAGADPEAQRLADSDRVELRRQAHSWLGAELAARAGGQSSQPESAGRLLAFLEHWLRDPDLASVRDADALRLLSPDEQTAWRELWNEARQVQARVKTEVAAAVVQRPVPEPPPTTEEQKPEPALRAPLPLGTDRRAADALTLSLLAGVTAELKLSDLQSEQIAALQAENRKAISDFQRQSNDLAFGQLVKLLQPEQAQRLEQIHLQLRGMIALADPDIAARLGLTAAQKEQVSGIVEEFRKRQAEFRRAMTGNATVPLAQFRELSDETAKALFLILTDDQRQIFKDFVGELFDRRKLTPARPAPQ
jgi:Tfp pilus assembly protein PilF